MLDTTLPRNAMKCLKFSTEFARHGGWVLLNGKLSTNIDSNSTTEKQWQHKQQPKQSATTATTTTTHNRFFGRVATSRSCMSTQNTSGWLSQGCRPLLVMPLHRHLADPADPKEISLATMEIISLGFHSDLFSNPCRSTTRPNQTRVCSFGFRACDQELDKARCE